jgi:hypothetical protein
MLSPVHGNLRRVQAEFPLIQVVQISRASSYLPAPSGAYQRCPPFRGRISTRGAWEGRTSIDAAKSELGRTEKQIKATVDAIADGMYHTNP